MNKGAAAATAAAATAAAARESCKSSKESSKKSMEEEKEDKAKKKNGVNLRTNPVPPPGEGVPVRALPTIATASRRMLAVGETAAERANRGVGGGGRLGEALNGWFWSLKRVVFANLLNASPSSSAAASSSVKSAAERHIRRTGDWEVALSFLISI